MAAQKSIAKPAAAPARAAKADASPRARARRPRSPRKTASQVPRRPSRQEDGPPTLAADELLELLSSRLDLIEAISLALRTLEDRPDVGPICTALEHGVQELGRAHEAVGLYVQGRSE